MYNMPCWWSCGTNSQLDAGTSGSTEYRSPSDCSSRCMVPVFLRTCWGKACVQNHHSIFLPFFVLVRFLSAHLHASFCDLMPASTGSCASWHSPRYCLSAAMSDTMTAQLSMIHRYFKILIKLMQYVNRLPSVESLD